MSLYGLILASAFLLAFSYFQKTTQLSKFLHEHLLIGLLISGLLGARTYHILDNLNYYQLNPSEIIKTWHGGLGVYGAILACLLFLAYFCNKHRLNLLKLLNDLAPAVALAQAIGRWGNFTNLEVFGTPTLTKLGQYIPFHLRPTQFQSFSHFHPVWLYESLGCLLLFYYLHLHKKNRLATYLISYGLLRFGLEYLRFDTWQFQGFKVAQLLSLIFIALGLILYKNKK